MKQIEMEAIIEADLDWDERLCIELRSAGYGPIAIARRMHISPRRIEVILRHAAKKMGYLTITEAAETLGWPDVKNGHGGFIATPPARGERVKKLMLSPGDPVHTHTPNGTLRGVVAGSNRSVVLLADGREWVRTRCHTGEDC